MKSRRKIIVYIATSADGYIARPDGDVEWLNRMPGNAEYGMKRFYSTIDRILWGRKTYDWLLNYHKRRGKTKGLFDTSVANYVFSRKPPKRPAEGVGFVSQSVKTFARRLRAAPGRHIWMMGGGGLIASFLDAGEIDEFDIHVMPVFIGTGIPLMTPRRRDVLLRLRTSQKYPNGVVRLRYELPRREIASISNARHARTRRVVRWPMMDPIMTRRDAIATIASAATVPLLFGCARDGGSAPPPSSGGTEADALKLLDSIADNLLKLQPEAATSLGIDTGARAALRSELADRSKQGQQRLAQQVKADLDRVTGLDSAGLSHAARTS